MPWIFDLGNWARVATQDSSPDWAETIADDLLYGISGRVVAVALILITTSAMMGWIIDSRTGQPARSRTYRRIVILELLALWLIRQIIAEFIAWLDDPLSGLVLMLSGATIVFYLLPMSVLGGPSSSKQDEDV